jgi:hypothetical protein
MRNALERKYSRALRDYRKIKSAYGRHSVATSKEFYRLKVFEVKLNNCKED